ncbi:hypothetical protein [Bartonella alsatica]|nr:hypothetical protein [Bartonella alsatica]
MSWHGNIGGVEGDSFWKQTKDQAFELPRELIIGFKARVNV